MALVENGKRALVIVDLVGLATDYCVRSTTLDAVHAGFKARVLTGMAAGVNRDTTAAALDEMAAAGVELVSP